jgi:pyruvate/2-oxoglutarate dehydrogenase complex dihydrolipoamide acyltransferase (E2) component
MIYRLTVPAAVPDVDEIRILEWHGAAGHVFVAGELVVELETHKAVVEVRAGQPGVLREIMAEPGDWKAIGLPLALFSDVADEAIPDGDDKLSDLMVDFRVT